MTKTTPGKIWVLTREHAEYDQHGAYFVCAFAKHPSLEVIAPIVQAEIGLGNDMGQAITVCEHVRKGGGQMNNEGVWLCLDEVKLK